jgi:hydrogenase nickel incorporation protein HypA/HybF
MHELSIASAILEAATAEARRHPGRTPLKLGVRIGALSGVDREALEFCFEALVKDTELAALTLDIEACPRRHRCPRCDRTFDVADFDVACPECGDLGTEMVSGDELELSYLEVSDP